MWQVQTACYSVCSLVHCNARLATRRASAGVAMLTPNLALAQCFAAKHLTSALSTLHAIYVSSLYRFCAALWGVCTSTFSLYMCLLFGAVTGSLGHRAWKPHGLMSSGQSAPIQAARIGFEPCCDLLSEVITHLNLYKTQECQGSLSVHLLCLCALSSVQFSIDLVAPTGNAPHATTTTSERARRDRGAS